MQKLKTLDCIGPRTHHEQREIAGAVPPAIEIGQVVIAKRKTSICEAGDLGVCFDVIEQSAPSKNNRSGKRYGIIFETGGYNLFDGSRLDTVVSPCLFVCDEALGYKYQSPALLERDFRYGVFDRALAALHARPEDAVNAGAVRQNGETYRFWRRRFGARVYTWAEVSVGKDTFLPLPCPYPAFSWPAEELRIQTNITFQRAAKSLSSRA